MAFYCYRLRRPDVKRNIVVSYGRVITFNFVEQGEKRLVRLALANPGRYEPDKASAGGNSKQVGDVTLGYDGGAGLVGEGSGFVIDQSMALAPSSG